MINIEKNCDFETMQSSWLYTQFGFLYLLKLEGEQGEFSTIYFFLIGAKPRNSRLDPHTWVLALIQFPPD